MVRLCVMINLCYDVIMKELRRGEEKLPSFYDFTTIELHLFAYIRMSEVVAIFGEGARRVSICKPVHTCICTYIRTYVCVACILHVRTCIFTMCFHSSVFLEYIDLAKHF